MKAKKQVQLSSLLEEATTTTTTIKTGKVSWDFLSVTGAGSREDVLRTTNEWLTHDTDGEEIELDENDILTLYLLAGQFSLDSATVEEEAEARKKRAVANAKKFLKDQKFAHARVTRITNDAAAWKEFLGKRARPGVGVSKNLLLQTAAMRPHMESLFVLMDGDTKLKRGVRRSQHYWYRFDQESLLDALKRQQAIIEQSMKLLQPYDVLKADYKPDARIKDVFMNKFHLDVSDASTLVYAPCIQECRKKVDPAKDMCSTLLSAHMAFVSNLYCKAHKLPEVKLLEEQLMTYKIGINWIQANFKALRYRGKAASDRILYPNFDPAEWKAFRMAAQKLQVGIQL